MISIESAIDHYNKRHYETSIILSGKSVEFGLRELYNNLKNHYESKGEKSKRNSLVGQFEYLRPGQKSFNINKITLGSLITRYNYARMWNRISEIREKRFHFLFSIDWEELKNLRNAAVHHKINPNKEDAEKMLTYAKIFLLETGLYGKYTAEDHILDPSKLAEIKYQYFCEGIWCDQVITKNEKLKLDEFRVKLGLSRDKALEIEEKVIPKNYCELLDILDSILMDGKVYKYEANYFLNKARELQIPHELAIQLLDEHDPKNFTNEIPKNDYLEEYKSTEYAKLTFKNFQYQLSTTEQSSTNNRQ